MARVPAIAVPDPSRRNLLVLGAGLGLAALGARPSRAAVDPADVFADADVPVLGNPKGDVAVAVWFDYQCPFCKKVEPILNEVARKDGKVAKRGRGWHPVDPTGTPAPAVPAPEAAPAFEMPGTPGAPA